MSEEQTDCFNRCASDDVEQLLRSMGVVEKEIFKRITKKFATCFMNKIGEMREFSMGINTKDAKPIKMKPFRQNPFLRKKLKEMVDELCEEGIVKSSKSPWCSAAWLIEKRQKGEYRMVIDYRKLNSVTESDQFRPPRIDDTLESLGAGRIFSALDLRSGFYQLPVEGSSIPKTAFITSFGLFEFVRMPFGLKNGPAEYQRVMERILEGLLGKICLVYLDDIIIFSKNLEDHESDLSQVMTRLMKAGITLKVNKCEFFKRELDYLGHHICDGKISPVSRNIEKLMSSKRPQNVKEIRRFLGLSGYYRKFIKGYATLANPLTELTKQGTTFTWGDLQEVSYQTIVRILNEKPFLQQPDWDVPFVLETDASAVGLGAVLMQNGLPVVYGSKTLNNAERKYSATEREILAIVHFCDSFRYFLEGRKFTLRTDHQPLVYMARQADPHHKYARWISRLQAYDFDLEYTPGVENLAADYFSRDVASMTLTRVGLRSVNFLDEQQKDQELVEIVNSTDFPPKSTYSPWRKLLTVDDGLVRVKDKVVVPRQMRHEIISSWHSINDIGHIGVNKMRQQLRKRYFWPGMDEDVERFVKECPNCQTTKNVKIRASLQPKVVDEVFHTLQMDLTGKIKVGGDSKFILVVVDVASRFPFLVTLNRVSAEAIANGLVKEVFPLTGIPRYLQTDNERCFSGVEIGTICDKLGIKKREVSVYHPQAQGIVERLIKTIKTTLLKASGSKVKSWDEIIPLLTLHLRTQPHQSLGISPSEYLFGTPTRNIPEAAYDSKWTIKASNSKQRSMQERLESWHERIRQVRTLANWTMGEQTAHRKRKADDLADDPTYEVGEKVLFKPDVGNPGYTGRGAPLYTNVYKVVNRQSAVLWKVSELDGSAEYVFHTNNLKKAEGDRISRIHQQTRRRVVRHE